MFRKAKQYILDSRDELKQVQWPPRREALYLSFVVILFSVILALFLGILDMLFSYLLKTFVL